MESNILNKYAVTETFKNNNKQKQREVINKKLLIILKQALTKT